MSSYSCRDTSRVSTRRGWGRTEGEGEEGDVRVGAEVEEELEEGEAHDERGRAQLVEVAREDAHYDARTHTVSQPNPSNKRQMREQCERALTEQRSKQKSLNLYPLPPQLLNRQDRHIIPGHEPERRDDQVPDADLEQAVPRAALGAVEPDLLQDDVLVQVDAVEGDVEQEPARARPHEHAQVPPLGEVREEVPEVARLGVCVLLRVRLCMRRSLGRV